MTKKKVLTIIIALFTFLAFSFASWAYTIYYYIDEAGNVHATDRPDSSHDWEEWGEEGDYEGEPPIDEDWEEDGEEGKEGEGEGEGEGEEEGEGEGEGEEGEEEKEEEEEDLRKKQAKAAAKAAADATQIIPAIGLTEIAREIYKADIPGHNKDWNDSYNEATGWEERPYPDVDYRRE